MAQKGKKSQFGYRGYLMMDAQDGYVRGIHTAPASQSEIKHFEAAIGSAHIEANRVYADKGSASNVNRQYQRKRKIKSAIMHEHKEQTALSTPEAGKSIDRQKTLYC